MSTHTSIPKSLHTVTALANLARYIDAQCMANDAAESVELAAAILGYGAAADSYALKSKARAVLASDAARAAAVSNADWLRAMTRKHGHCGQ